MGYVGYVGRLWHTNRQAFQAWAGSRCVFLSMHTWQTDQGWSFFHQTNRLLDAQKLDPDSLLFFYFDTIGYALHAGTAGVSRDLDLWVSP